VCVRLRCKLASEIKCGRALKVDRRFIVRKTRYILPSAPWHTVCSIKSYLHTPVFILYNIHLQCFACPLQRVTYGEACMWLWRRAAKLEGGWLCDRYNNNNNNITRRASYSLNTIPPTYTHTHTHSTVSRDNYAYARISKRLLLLLLFLFHEVLVSRTSYYIQYPLKNICNTTLLARWMAMRQKLIPLWRLVHTYHDDGQSKAFDLGPCTDILLESAVYENTYIYKYTVGLKHNKGHKIIQKYPKNNVSCGYTTNETEPAVVLYTRICITVIFSKHSKLRFGPTICALCNACDLFGWPGCGLGYYYIILCVFFFFCENCSFCTVSYIVAV